jgi:polysaccharide export outer membrane protein
MMTNLHKMVKTLNMHSVKILASALILTGATGCTIVPGSDMNRINSAWFDDTSENYKPAKTDIKYISINADVISHLRSIPKGGPEINPQLQIDLQNYQYHIGPGDVLNITVWEHPELTIPSGSFRSASEGGNEVKADGTIFYPYVGVVSVEGMTTNQVRELILDKLSSVIKKPQVDVRVSDYRSKKVFVSGAVAKPGVQALTKTPLTLVEAVEKAGGLAKDAAWDNIQLSRNGETRTFSLGKIYQNGDWRQNILLQDGDMLHILNNDYDKIFILGEVRRPQSIVMSRSGTTLAEALSESYGINENKADIRGIYVLRNTTVDYDQDGLPTYKATIFNLDTTSAIGFMLADSFPLQARDVVYVAPAPITKWNRFISQLIPSLLATDRVGDIERN